MRSDNPARRWLIHVTLLMLFVPLFWGLLTARYFGLLGAFQRSGPISLWLIGVTGGYVVALVLLLRWGALRTALIVFLVAGYLQITALADYSAPGSPTLLQFGKGCEVLGIDVYCNDVFIGTTPFEIREAEFSSRVPRWHVPPLQPNVVGFHPSTSATIDLSFARFSLVPHDPFHEEEKFGHTGLSWGGWSDVVKRLPEVGYWWRFEKQGCQGLATIENFGGGRAGDIGWTNPHVTFPASKPHWKLLFDDLRERNYVPTEEWLAHVAQWAEVLWPLIDESSRNDERMAAIRRRIALRRHGLSDENSSEECRQAWDAILAQINRQNVFAESSIESEGLLEIACRHPRWVVEAYLPLSLEFQFSGGARFGIGGRNAFAPNSPGDARRHALEYLIAAGNHPELFDRMSLQYALVGGDWHRQILEGYLYSSAISSEQKAAVRHQLRGSKTDWKAIVKEVSYPGATEDAALDDVVFAELANLPREKIKLEELESFVVSRRRGSPARRAKLVNWLLTFPHVGEDNRGRLLSMIESPMLREPDIRAKIPPQSYSLIVDRVGVYPNPYADKLVIDIWEAWREKDPRSIGDHRLSSILAIDTPTIREWMHQKLESDRQEWSPIARGAVAPLPHLKGLVPRLSEFTADEDRVAAVSLLAAIDTPDAWEVIEQWSKSSSDWVRNQAAEKIALRDKARAERKLARQQLTDLYSGRIHPDDLLPPPMRYVWIGTAYERVETEGQSAAQSEKSP